MGSRNEAAPRNTRGLIHNPCDLGSAIRNRRKELGYTQADLAAFCGCSIRFVSELERGVAGGNITQVLEICNAIGLDVFVRGRG